LKALQKDPSFSPSYFENFNNEEIDTKVFPCGKILKLGEDEGYSTESGNYGNRLEEHPEEDDEETDD
jgi:hypothetical protein